MNNDGRAAAAGQRQLTAAERQQLWSRYEQERAKRLRADGDGQYLHLGGETSHYLDDPYVTPGFTRSARSDDVTAIVIGGGFGGLMCAARLIELGVTDLLLIEKGGDFGGAWYWNRYPGASYDIESYIYMPLLEELDYIPSQKYARADEIREHCQRIGRHYALYDKALFQTEITHAAWNEAQQRWIVETDRGDRLSTRFLSIAAGPLQRPKLPDIPGLLQFKGKTFHTSRWDYDYTGGGEHAPLNNLKDKVVGIVGTGATAVQCVPYLAQSAKHLYVFQRTPPTVGVRNNRPTSSNFASELKPGWQQARRNNFTRIICSLVEETNLVNDGWTHIHPPLLGFASAERKAEIAQDHGGFEALQAAVEAFDFDLVQALRDRIDQLVEDPATAEALKPYYKIGCKRPCFHDEYLQVFNQTNVTLVNTDGRGVEQIDSAGVYACGRHYPLDCLIFATGFEWGANYTDKAGFNLIGRNNQSLREKWQDGPRTLHGTYTSGFPNCFFLTHIQAAITPSFTHVADEQAKHFAAVIKSLTDRQVASFDVRLDAEEDYTQEVERLAAPRLAYEASCTPSYLNHEGRIDRKLARNGPHGEGPLAYLDRIAQWRAAGDFEGMALQYA